ncbi:NAD-dependent epimerase/dehydratase family protein [Chloroflexota bacterium]
MAPKQSTGHKGKCLVTGVAGFIGSNLAERLINEGFEVTGIDCFSDYYPRNIKQGNLIHLAEMANFSLVEANLCTCDLSKLLSDVDYVFHHAAEPGVRASWGKRFAVYTENNIMATQKLLEAAKDKDIKKFVYASSSSIYGNAVELPTSETSLPAPISPYGMSKLAAEHLCHLYHQAFGVPTISLRYFTVYGPRQRPDMAFTKFIRAIMEEKPITIYGDGEQTRDFTFISDAVDANLKAAHSDISGLAFNIGGGSRVTLNQALKTLQNMAGKEANIFYQETQMGDARHTFADVAKAKGLMGWVPEVTLEQGLRAQVEWFKGKNYEIG